MDQQQVPDGYEETTTIFKPEGVSIRIRTNNSPVMVRKLDLDPQTLPSLMKSLGGRVVISYEIVSRDCMVLEVLDQLYELEVRYTKADLDLVGDYRNLQLCYYKNGIWNPFTKKRDKFRLVPDPMILENPPVETGGVGRVYINFGSDPTIGWK